MRLETGNQWVRLEVLTPTNLGSDHGTAPVDRPTVRDSLLDLPYLPDSVLKGVTAGQLGDIDDVHPERSNRRERYYGSPDRPEAMDNRQQWGRPGPVIFGNGELVAFPVATRNGHRAWVVPAPLFARLLHLDQSGAGEADAMGLLDRIEQGDRAAVGWPTPVAFTRPIEPEWLTGESITRRWPALAPHILRFLGTVPRPGEALVIAGGELSRDLWAAAAEIRTLTALDSALKTVSPGTLRTVELIPSGTVFASLVSFLEEGEGPQLPELLQVGGWESLGLGWLALEPVQGLPATHRPPEAGTGLTARVQDADVMVEMHRAVSDLDPAAQPELSASLRAAIPNFGPRARQSGIEAAVAFSLSKAKPASSEPKPEARAHRWLLRTVLALGPDPGEAGGRAARLLSWLEIDPFRPGALSAEADAILGRWLWLRRFSELYLAPAASEDRP